MPAISMFYGIIVSMYFLDNRRHHRPHVHARYQDDEAVVAIDDIEVLEGKLRRGKCDCFKPGLKSSEMNCSRIGSLPSAVSNHSKSSH
jgi:hypothetical protein